MFDSLMTDLGLVSAGVAYFAVYVFVVMKFTKLKLIHSLWIPLAYAAIYSTYVIILLQTPWFGANRTLLSQVWVVTEVNLPVLAYLVFAGLTVLIKKKSA